MHIFIPPYLYHIYFIISSGIYTFSSIIFFCYSLIVGRISLEVYSMEDITKNSLQVIGKNVRTARIMKGLSQETLAEKLEKSINFVSLLENGKTGFSIQTIIDLCSALEVDANFIFEGVIAPPTATTDAYITNSLSLFSETDRGIVENLITYILNSKT
jgi:transcriptional regulator with XRE-family HTH domain